MKNKSTRVALTGSSVGQGIIPRHQGLDAWSGRVRESTAGCTDKWNNKSVFLSLPLSLKSIFLRLYFQGSFL